MIELYSQELQYSGLKHCQIVWAYWSVIIGSELMVGREHSGICSVVSKCHSALGPLYFIFLFFSFYLFSLILFLFYFILFLFLGQ